MSYRLTQNAFGRWIVLHPTDDLRAWSGSRWVAIDGQGMPAGEAQVSNFDSEAAAREYAGTFA
jgi:hypothetical protein